MEPILESLIARFEEECRKGVFPNIEEFLLDVPEQERKTLLQELIALEVSYRKQAGETINSAPYQSRFPEYSSIVTNAIEQADWNTIAPTATAPSMAEDVQLGTVVGAKYTLADVIGEGGMGSVWIAKQTTPIKRDVAVKLIKKGMDSKQVLVRFEAERQALGMMDHPNIAKVLDGGLHQGRPYFVMELVNGCPITEYCDTHRLTLHKRLELFVNVCQAIQHAHQKGIIHRDIKPSNVLVAVYDDRPVVKVIDFGVAKATGGSLTDVTIETGIGSIIGTPTYMSPEQATLNNLDIDTRSDVYSLGVLLYELLTGSPPFTRKELEVKGLMEMLRVVREEDPPRPSDKITKAETLTTLSANRRIEPKKFTGLLRNELDWIVLKAIEKERARRYDSANGLAADVQRYLGGEPVSAHPPGTAYRLKKLFRRYRGQMVAASLILLSLIVGLAGTGLGLIEARKQKSLADNERKNAETRLVTAASNSALLRSKIRTTGWPLQNQREIQSVSHLVEDDRQEQALRGLWADTLIGQSIEPIGEPLSFTVEVSKLLYTTDGQSIVLGGNRSISSSEESLITLPQFSIQITHLASGEHKKIFIKDNVLKRLERVNGVQSMLLSPSGNLLWIGTRHGEVISLDVKTGEQLVRSELLKNDVVGIASSGNEDEVVVCTKDGILSKLSKAGKTLQQATIPSPVSSLCGCPSGSIIAMSKPATLIDKSLGVTQIESTVDSSCCAPIMDGTGIVCAHGNGIAVCDMELQPIRQWKSDKLDSVKRLALEPKQRWIVAADRFNLVVFDFGSGKAIGDIAFSDTIYDVAFHPEGHEFAVSFDKHVQRYRITTSNAWQTMVSQSTEIVDFSIDRSSQRIATIAQFTRNKPQWRSLISLHSLTDAIVTPPLRVEPVADEVELLQNGQLITIVADNSQSVYGYDVETRERRREKKGAQFEMLTQDPLEPSHGWVLGTRDSIVDGSKLYAFDTEFREFQVRWANDIEKITRNEGHILDYAILRDKVFIVTPSKFLLGVNRETGKRECSAPLTAPVNHGCMTIADDALCVGDREGYLSVRHLGDLTVRQLLQAHTSPITAVASIDNYVFSASQNGDWKIWKMVADELIENCTITQLQNPIKKMLTVPELNLLVIACDREACIRVLKVDVLLDSLRRTGLELP